MSLPIDYSERVYAGVLGKIIGVYLGRPIEGWTYDHIMRELGEVWYYVHDKLGKPLIVTDDDISGTFTFLRAFPDNGNCRDLTAAQIGQTWMNYLIEERTVLWWGGLGNSTEHTAYLRLKEGIEPPRSGSIELNGKVVAEQIGAQIFIDGWAMVAPGDPEYAADLARRAASVSHDGEAIYAAQVLAAMEAQAFVETDIEKLIDTAVTLVPSDSVVYQMIADLREWHSVEPDWQQARERLEALYGYEKYGGNCHTVPNHGVIILSLLYCRDNFQRSLMIANTCGWDTDCNSGNVGCLMGIKNSLAGIDAGPDWRGPVADRMYLPTSDGGRAITDAVRESFHIVNIGRALAGQSPVQPKGGARFHFELSGSLHGFQPEESVETSGTVTIGNVRGHSVSGERSLELRLCGLAPGRVARVATATFTPPNAKNQHNYHLIASPTIYSGQTVQARLEADKKNRGEVVVRLYVRSFGADDNLIRSYGPQSVLNPGSEIELEWLLGEGRPVEPTGPIAEIGIEVCSDQHGDGSVYLDYLTWSGEPDVILTCPETGGGMWRKAWVDAADNFTGRGEPFRLIQNSGIGLLIHGAREWSDYRVSADITPHLVKAVGIAARVQGLRRFYALMFCRDTAGAEGMVRLIKMLGSSSVLAETKWPWVLGGTYDLSLEVVGTNLRASVDGQAVFDVTDSDSTLSGGAVALVCEEGRTSTHAVRVCPVGTKKQD